MPVGFSSAARNLFLLGSTGAQVVSNFFKRIDQSTGTDGVYLPDEIRFNALDEKFLLAGSASDSNLKDFGWFEKRTTGGTSDWDVRVEATQGGINTTLRAMELDSNNNLIVVGKTGDIPWIAKYDNNGIIDWQSTTNSADVEYTGITSDSNGNYYACGSTPINGEATAFVEKFDASGNPGWGKAAFMLGRDVVLNKVAANNRGEVVAVGYLEDDSSDKGYIVKIDTTTGEVLWDRTLDDNSTDPVVCNDVFIDDNDQIYVVGNVGDKGYIVKYTAEGNIIWQKFSANTLDTITYKNVKSDSETEQTIVFGTYDNISSEAGILTKYSKNGDLVWRRILYSSFNFTDTFSNVNLDADPSFYYILFTDEEINEPAATPLSYTFGKVSSSGNGLGNFEYFDGSGETIYYEILGTGDEIGRLSDGSVRQDSSDLITYPFSANKLLFDDLATQVSNKKRQMDSPDSFEYSGSPAIRPADFQELNLLGDNVSDRIWNDTSGKGNNGVASLTEPFFGAGGVSFDGSGDDLSVPFNSTLLSDFTIELWVYRNNTNRHCFISLWDTTGTNRWRFEVERTAGKANFTDTGSNNNEFDYTSSSNEWVHWAITRQGTTARMFENGIQIGSWTSSTTLGVGVSNPLTIGRLGGGGTDYVDGFISNVRIVEGTAIYTSNFTPPTTPLTAISGTELLTCQGDTIADASSNNLTITANGNAAPTNDGPTWNASGWWEFDGVDDYISIDKILTQGSELTIESWFNTNTLSATQYIVDQSVGLTGCFIRVLSTNQNLSALVRYNAGNGIFLEGTISSNTWHHAILTISAGENRVRLYIDGILQDENTTIFTNITTPPEGSPFAIGSDYQLDSEFFDGEIGEVRIYPRALTAAQVFQNYNATREKYTGVPASVYPNLDLKIKNGLVLDLDAANPLSYPGTGTTWFDLSGNGNDVIMDATLVPIFENNSYFRVNNGANFEKTDANISLNSITMIAWYKNIAYTGGSSPRILELHKTGSTVSFSHALAPNNDGSLRAWVEGGNSTSLNRIASVDDPTQYPLNEWIMFAYTYDGSIGRIYVNGQQTATASGSSTQLDDINIITIGAIPDFNTYQHSDFYMNAQISQISIYDRALNETEVLINFNSTRGKYGV